MQYTVSMENPQTHYFEIKIDLTDFRERVSDPDQLRLVMPVWTPGSYLVREFSRNILEVKSISTESQESLLVYKVNKNTWVVETKGSDKIQIRYKVYAFELTVDTSYLDNVHGIINGASVFAYIEGLEKDESVLEIVPFRDWKKVSTGLKRLSKEGSEHLFVVPNYDILVDSPIEIGNQLVHHFGVGDTKYEVSIFSIKRFEERSFVSDLQKIVEETIKVFSHVPFDQYLFLADFTSDNYGGLEHLNSTHCIAPIFRLDPPYEYHELLTLFSHEFFHAWNVKRLRPVGFGPFDYSREIYSKSLWISEGITSYYDDLLLRRCGIYSVPEYLDAFSANVNTIKVLPGSKWQSAEEASFDAWIKHYRQNENSPNVLSSYYLQGTVIGWMLDMEIRRISNSAKNLDDVLREVYEKSFVKDNRGFTDEEFEEACEKIGGSSVQKIYEDRVKGRESIDFDKYLGYSGLMIVPQKHKSGQGFLGIRTKDDSGRLMVATVLSSSSAEDSGMAPSDEIIGADGVRMDRSRFAYYVSNRKPEERIRITVARFGSIMDLDAKLNEKPILEYRIVKKENATESEKQLFGKWLGHSWDLGLVYEEHARSPVRPNPLDYM
ncbi:MAG: PDZ domain-containing protein [Thaumarchaeota archaeon]|nr:PDZ domain-containing protein [Nitrososphaerota archaeon]